MQIKGKRPEELDKSLFAKGSMPLVSPNLMLYCCLSCDFFFNPSMRCVTLTRERTHRPPSAPFRQPRVPKTGSAQQRRHGPQHCSRPRHLSSVPCCPPLLMTLRGASKRSRHRLTRSWWQSRWRQRRCVGRQGIERPASGFAQSCTSACHTCLAVCCRCALTLNCWPFSVFWGAAASAGVCPYLAAPKFVST